MATYLADLFRLSLAILIISFSGLSAAASSKDVKIAGKFASKSGALISIELAPDDSNVIFIEATDNGGQKWVGIGFYTKNCGCIKSVFRYKNEKLGDDAGYHKLEIKENGNVVVKHGGWDSTTEFGSEFFYRKDSDARQDKVGDSSKSATSRNLGGYVSVNGCDPSDNRLEVVRLTTGKGGDSAYRHHYLCDTKAGTYKLDYGEFKGAAPIGFTPKATPKEGINLELTKLSNGEFQLATSTKSYYKFDSTGDVIIEFAGKELKEQIVKLLKSKNNGLSKQEIAEFNEMISPQGRVVFRRFTNKHDVADIESSDLNKWFSKS